MERSRVPELDIAARAAAHHGQTPTWDSRTDTVLWADAPAATVHRYSPGRDVDHTMRAPQAVSAAKPRSRGGLLLHLDEGIALFEADGQTRTWLVYWARENVHGGETITDSYGRLWATTTPADPASGDAADGWLVRVTSNGAATTVLRGLPAAFGLAFSADGSRLYLADGHTGRIDRLDCTPETGEATGRRPLCDTGAAPAGLCVDAAGCLWVTMRDAGRVHRYTPDGVLDQTITLPARHPTGCCFGGNKLTDLYVTTASAPDPAAADGALLVLPELGSGLRTAAFAG